MVIVDDLVGSRHEAGDLIQADAASDCGWTWNDLSGSLQALVTGELTDKVSKAEQAITLFKSVGAARFDAAVAFYITQLAREKNLGENVNW